MVDSLFEGDRPARISALIVTVQSSLAGQSLISLIVGISAHDTFQSRVFF
jgi:hypothetical protein